MTTEQAIQTKHLNALAEIMSSLRLKDVLDAAVVQFAQLSQANKVAVFLADNQSKNFRLMASKGYSELSLQQMKLVPFNGDGILADVVNDRKPTVLKLGSHINGFNKAVFEREHSVNQAALPLATADLLIGAILIDSNGLILLDDIEIWRLTTNLSAIAIANAIIFGRSEYERERLNTLYKILSAFQVSALNLNQVLQKTADAALVLANTPYCAILLCEKDKPDLSLAAFKGFDGSSLINFDLSVSNTLAGCALAEGKTKQLGKNEQNVSVLPKAMGGETFRSAVALPLIGEGKKIGVLEVFSIDDGAFQSEQLELLEALVVEASSAVALSQKHETAIAQMKHDPHTGLLNRFYFQSALKAEIERSNRHNHQLSLLLIDIDYLSRVNDRFGEEKGDEVIAKIAKVIQSTLREIDLVYRFGGEEFAVVLPETPRKDIGIVLERLREKINKLAVSDIGTISVSMGVSTYPDHSRDAKELEDLAELALYLAKYQGRDRVIEAPIPTVGGDTNTWIELAKYAKQAVSAERRERAKSHLSSSADYANWLLKMKNSSKKNIVKKDQVPLP